MPRIHGGCWSVVVHPTTTCGRIGGSQYGVGDETELYVAPSLLPVGFGPFRLSGCSYLNLMDHDMMVNQRLEIRIRSGRGRNEYENHSSGLVLYTTDPLLGLAQMAAVNIGFMCLPMFN